MSSKGDEMLPVHIAVVDDEAEIETIYQFALREFIRDEKAVLHFFISGQKLLDFLSEKGKEIKILILVSDINMPEMNGIELIQKIRIDFPYIDLYLSSAYDASMYEEQMKKHDVIDFFEKPVDFERINQMIEHKIRSFN